MNANLKAIAQVVGALIVLFILQGDDAEPENSPTLTLQLADEEI